MTGETTIISRVEWRDFRQRPMTVLICMLRGVNVGPHNRIKMDSLRALFVSLKLEEPCTYVQSGNVIFRAKERNRVQLSKTIQREIEKQFGCRPEVILRSLDELRQAVADTPFAERHEFEPAKILVTFLADDPGQQAQARLRELEKYPEEVHLRGREMYIYFPQGAGQSKLPWSRLEKLLGVTGTARNWNSVMNILKIAEKMAADE